MSRSRKKTPKSGYTTSDSEKEEKKIASRKFRRAVRDAIYHEREMPQMKEIWDSEYDGSKDGKAWLPNWNCVKEDPEELKRFIRK